jgi:LTXXQ motif family protein
MSHNHTLKSMLFAALALSAVSIQPAFSDDDGWFWNRGRMGEWFRGEMMDNDMRWGWGHGMMMGRKFGEERLNALKDELAITATQQKAWDDYAKSVNTAVDSMRETHKNMMSGDIPKTLPERIAFHENMMTARLEDMKTTDAATLTLYNALDANQKKKADELILGMGMM